MSGDRDLLPRTKMRAFQEENVVNKLFPVITDDGNVILIIHKPFVPTFILAKVILV